MIKLKRLKVSEMSLVDRIQQVNLLGSGYTYTFSSDGTYSRTDDENNYNTISAGGSEYTTNNELTCETYYDMYGNMGGSEITGLDYGGFKFLADKTNVEWGAFLNGGVNASDGTPCILQTSHSHTACLAAYSTSDLQNYDTYMHSHPKDGYYRYSESDWTTWVSMYSDGVYKMANFGIYTVSNHKSTSYTNDVKNNIHNPVD